MRSPDKIDSDFGDFYALSFVDDVDINRCWQILKLESRQTRKLMLQLFNRLRSSSPTVLAPLSLTPRFIQLLLFYSSAAVGDLSDFLRFSERGAQFCYQILNGRVPTAAFVGPYTQFKEPQNGS